MAVLHKRTPRNSDIQNFTYNQLSYSKQNKFGFTRIDEQLISTAPGSNETKIFGDFSQAGVNVLGWERKVNFGIIDI